MAFNELKTKLGRKTLRSRSEDEFINIIIRSGMIDETLDKIKSNCVAWANAGGRYRKIAHDLGGKGVLMLLPEDIPRNM